MKPKIVDMENILDFAALYNKIQDGDQYRTIIIELRANHQLHPFVEWVLTQKIRRFLDTGSFKIEAEKYGISNGRIDLALYHQPRSVIHFELIASNSGDHVFRDTTSLLVSEADTKLAILIDDDIDSTIATNFYKAIAHNQIPSIWLRTALLEADKEMFRSQLQDLISEAEFLNGSTRMGDFYCTLSSTSIACYDKLVFKYKNAIAGDRLEVRIRTPNSIINLYGSEVESAFGEVELTIPFDQSLSRNRHRIEAVLSGGGKWARPIYVNRDTPAPSIQTQPSEVEPGQDFEIHVEHFPPNVELNCYVWQENSGSSCNHTRLITDANGATKGTCRIPAFVTGKFVRNGKHKLSADVNGVPRATAWTYIFVQTSGGPPELSMPLSQSVANALLGQRVDGIGIRKSELIIDFEYLNFSKYDLTLDSLLVTVKDKASQLPVTVLIPEFVQFGQIRLRSGEKYEFSETFKITNWLSEKPDSSSLTENERFFLSLISVLHCDNIPVTLEWNYALTGEQASLLLLGSIR